jgi:hypothetical protein
MIVQYAHARAQRIQQVAYFRIYTDIDGDGISQPIHNPPAVSVTGGTARWIRAVIPSVSVPGEGFDLKVAILDQLGFPAQDYLGTITFSSNGILKNLPQSYTFTADDRYIHVFQGVSFEKPGVFVIRVADDLHRTISNACRVNPGPHLGCSGGHTLAFKSFGRVTFAGRRIPVRQGMWPFSISPQ